MSRFYSRRIQGIKSSQIIRKEFLDYFINDLDHKYIKSSPVMPHCDPTVPFVNAGMNQFKGIFLGLYNPPALRVANSQKCIRIGGKHNDLEVVGHDTYHHTFFEMLGNWSFGDYFKEKACENAWNLLTGPYGIDKNCLYVTYFGGDEKMGLKADLECQDIWLKLGVTRDRILAFGMRDNFWEMGVTGPCGPSTEIHVDHTMQTSNQSFRVNKGHSDLTELWNIVFIEYERLPDGPIIPLPKKHIDTGMGFERLVAILQGQRSNYDTDLFSPLFHAIKKKSNAPAYRGRFRAADNDGIDTAYRTMADYSRMVTVALADGMLPDRSHKLRRVLRKAVDIGEKAFRVDGLLREMSFHVAEILGEVYPELRKNLNQVQKIIEYEEDWLKSLKDTSGSEWSKIVKSRPVLATITNTTAPGLVAAYKDLHSQSPGSTTKEPPELLSPELSFKMYDTYGLDPETISELARVESLSFDKNEFEKVLNDVRQRSKANRGKNDKDILTQSSLRLLELNKVPKTDDSPKYEYFVTHNEYEFPAVHCKLLGMVADGNLILEHHIETDNDSHEVVQATVTSNGNVVRMDSIINTNADVALILDKTPFYAPEGGQASDTGHIRIKNVVLQVEQVIKICDYVVHVGKFIAQGGVNPEIELRVGDECTATIDPTTRISLMRHHTATHLLNAALHALLPVTGQNGSSVFKDGLDFQFSVFGEKMESKLIENIEKLVNDAIEANVDVTTRTTDALGLSMEENITLVPGEIYPETGIRIVEIKSRDLESIEACCGTHVKTTGELDDFCILKVKSQGTGSRGIRAVAGPVARLTKLFGDKTKHNITQLEKDVNTDTTDLDVVSYKIQEIRRQLSNKTNRITLPYVVAQQCLSRLETLAKTVKIRKRNRLRSFIETEMKNIFQSSRLPFVVHCLGSNGEPIDSLSLENITDLCPTVPILVILHNDEIARVTCYVPKELVSNTFNAQTWIKTVLPAFNVNSVSLKGRDPISMQYMKSNKIPNSQLKAVIKKAISEATMFASQHMLKTERDDK